MCQLLLCFMLLSAGARASDSLYDAGPCCMPRAVPFPYVLAWLLGIVCVVDTHFIMTFSLVATTREFAEDISAWFLSHPRASDSVV